MKLRRLKIEDAQLMLEWMHDESIVHNLQTNFLNKTIEDCRIFIKSSLLDNKNDLSLAIVDNLDTYMGTVSLKHIDYIALNAEFAITIRKCAMGKGFSQYAMNEIFKIGFDDIHLENIVWCVSNNNLRAIRFYEKMGCEKINSIPENILKYYNDNRDLKWYGINKIVNEH